ncbi:flagellar filament capping protein FliD [Roseibium aggregatum]|uniref:flagellar filament capping protein FliD n=1 Tax=Roseibium aggregatum TaxID=187304 RepID=UPI003A987F4F
MSTTTDATSSSSTSYAYSTTSYSTSSSDVDWDALIEVAVEAKTTRADSIDVKIDDNEATIAAYEDMQSLLQDVLSALKTIRGTADSLTENDDIFSQREAYLTASGDVDAESAIIVTADEGVETATYDIQILQLAESQKIAGSTFEEETAEFGLSGTFSIGLEGMDAVELTVSEDMSLGDIAELIDAESETTGVSASVIKVAENEYRLILSGTETGQEISVSSVSGDDIGTALGLTDAGGGFVDELQAAQNAIITLEGIEITRSTNTVDDVIDGVTFNLYQETGSDASISVEISSDLTAIKEAVTGLVDAYNAYREWALTHQETSSGGGAADDATLFGDSTLRSANSAVAEALATIIDNDSMALLGLSYNSSNYLEIDEDTLNDALLNDLDAVEDLLAFQMDASSSDIALLNRNDNMPDSLILDIEVDAEGNIVGASVDGDDSLFYISGSRIKGSEGSIYEGITFVYTGDSSQTIEMSFSSGLVENLYNAIDVYANSDDGLLSDMITDLSDTNEDLESEASDIRSRAEDYRDRLTNLYSSYQAAIEEAQSTLDYLTALLDSGD